MLDSRSSFLLKKVGVSYPDSMPGVRLTPRFLRRVIINIHMQLIITVLHRLRIVCYDNGISIYFFSPCLSMFVLLGLPC